MSGVAKHQTFRFAGVRSDRRQLFGVHFQRQPDRDDLDAVELQPTRRVDGVVSARRRRREKYDEHVRYVDAIVWTDEDQPSDVAKGGAEISRTVNIRRPASEVEPCDGGGPQPLRNVDAVVEGDHRYASTVKGRAELADGLSNRRLRLVPGAGVDGRAGVKKKDDVQRSDTSWTRYKTLIVVDNVYCIRSTL